MARRLSQSDLGGDRYSASYLSYLESGRRRPTMEVVDYLAGRLGLTPRDLLGWQWDDRLPEQEAMVRLAELQTQVRESWRAGDHVATEAQAREAADLAFELHRSDAWWEMSLLGAGALLALARYEESADLAAEISEHPLASGSALLATEALVLAATALRAAGAGEAAMDAARRAETRSRDLGRTDTPRVKALIAVISTQLEFGTDEGGAPAVAELAAICEEIVQPQTIGEAAWTLGNVAFLRGDIAAGLRYHDLAAAKLNPATDLRGWGRYMKATAQVRISAGAMEGVSGYLDRARSALTIVGNPSDRFELMLTGAEYQLALGDVPAAMVELADGPQWETAAEAELAAGAALRARVYEAAGDLAAAAQAAATAASHYDNLGSLRAALDQWKVYSRLTEASAGGAVRREP